MIDYRYLAGIIDGEGSISIDRCLQYTNSRNKKRRNSYYHVRLVVANTDIRLMNWLKGCLGGDVQKKTKYNPKHRTGYNWRLNSNKAIAVLREVYPYLRLKKEQAEIAMELQDLLNRSAKNREWSPKKDRSSAQVELYHQLYLKLKNAKGQNHLQRLSETTASLKEAEAIV